MGKNKQFAKIGLSIVALTILAGCNTDRELATLSPKKVEDRIVGEKTAINTPNINRETLAGRILYHKDGTFFLRRDGKIVGTVAGSAPVEGTWWVDGRKFCRKLSGFNLQIGQTCETVQISGNQATFIMADGARNTYRLSRAQAN